MIKIDLCTKSQYVNDEFMKMLASHEHSMVALIDQTSSECPEQYDCYDEYGNQIAYIRLRNRVLEVTCPNVDLESDIVYHRTYSSESRNYGSFSSVEERTKAFDAIIDSIDLYYANRRLIRKVSASEYKADIIGQPIDERVTYRLAGYTTPEKAYEALYAYEESNFTPSEVAGIRRQGQVLGYKQALLAIIKDHRMVRGKFFPEANGRDGISDEHVESEVEYFKENYKQLREYYRNGIGSFVLPLAVIVINHLYGKKFEDFEAIFREYCKKGWNSL